EIIKFYGYPGEEHKVLTEDGYILTNFRLANPGGYPILLLHGMTATSDCWLVVGPTHDFAFLLWKLGFDVWLWNSRGNMYSNEHVKYKYNQERFFNFSVHDYGYYDTPATIDYILNITNQKTLITLGHSMGAGMYLLAGSTRPEYQKKVRLNILWGQAIMMEHIKRKRGIKWGFKLHVSEL
ncbi:hypothetical protein WDU94_011513, partial [Cyamophila willieti]